MKLPERAIDSHKGNFGRALLVGGSVGMAGAIAIAGISTLRAGAGLVSVAIPQAISEIVATFHPCYMTIPLANDEQGRLAESSVGQLEPFIRQATCVGIGPGLGRSASLEKVVSSIFYETKCPLVMDADGLNNLKFHDFNLKKIGGPRILTPHPGEFARMTGVVASDRSAQIQAACDLAQQTSWIIVLKGHATIVTDGEQLWTNKSGNPKMAVGGSGDCLTGIITALICQGLSPWEAAKFGTALHGTAGDIAAENLSCPSVLATDLIEALPAAFHRLAKEKV